MDGDEEEGDNRRRLYRLDNFRQRNIPKFQVQGYEYQLHFDLGDGDRSRTYSDLLVRLHGAIEGRKHIFVFHSYP